MRTIIKPDYINIRPVRTYTKPPPRDLKKNAFFGGMHIHNKLCGLQLQFTKKHKQVWPLFDGNNQIIHMGDFLNA